MTKKERLAPVALMFVAATLSFLTCEKLSRQAPSQFQDALSAALNQPITSQKSVAQAPRATEQPKNLAQRIAQKITHAVHSTVHSVQVITAQTTQSQPASANELDEASILHGPLDLSLVPGVIVLPKKQEPLASAGLYDKRTHQKL